MDLKRLTPEIAVAGQIMPEDVAAIAAAGYRAIICNRPDDEAPGQPPYAAIEAAARKAGIATRFVPVVPGKIGADDVTAFAEALRALPSPVLAYCRSGARSSSLWTLHGAA